MKKLRGFISVITILVLLIVSTVGMFALPIDNDNRKVSVAVVNEDRGMNLNGKLSTYGNDFTKLFVQNEDGKYEVTSRFAALEGLNEGKYDLAVIVPNDFTQKALTYDTKYPEQAALEYIKSPNATQVKSLNAEIVAHILKETANKSLVKVFTVELLKTVQEIQMKSLHMVENEMKYQSYFKDNIEVPMANSMNNFNDLLTQLSSEQNGLNHFDENVKIFNTDMESQYAIEQKHLIDFEELKAKQNETVSTVSTQLGNYNQILKKMNDDKYLQNIENMQQEGLKNIKAFIDDTKRNTLQLELQIKKAEAYKLKMASLRNSYNSIKASGKIKYFTNDLQNKDTNEKLKLIENQVNSLIQPNGSVATALNHVTQLAPQNLKEKFEGEFERACAVLPENLKSIPSEYGKENFESVKAFCHSSGFKMDTSNIEQTKVLYEKDATDEWSGASKEIIAHMMSPYIKGTYKRYDNTNSKIISTGDILENNVTHFDGVIDSTSTIQTVIKYREVKEYPDGIEIPSVYTPENQNIFEGFIQDEKGFQKNYKVFSNLLPKIVSVDGKETVFRPKQKEAIASMQKINALFQVYYGKTVTELLFDYNANQMKESSLPSDRKLHITGKTSGIQKFRPYAVIIPSGEKVEDLQGNMTDGAWEGSLIARVEKVFDYSTLKGEVTKAIATQLSNQLDDIIVQLDNYLTILKRYTDGALDISKLAADGISIEGLVAPESKYYLDRDISQVKQGSYNETVAKMKDQYNACESIAKDVSTYKMKFKDWMSEQEQGAHTFENSISMHKSEGKITVQMSDNQQQLLRNITELQKKVDSQIDETKQIFESSDKLKHDAETSKSKIETYAAKLQDTKVKFDGTVKSNSHFVNEFINKYINAQNGGADNSEFYQNYSKPVELKGKDVYNSNSLITFFIITLITIFSLIVAYFFNQWNVKRILVSDHEEISIYSGLTLQLCLLVLTGILIGGIIGYIGIQSLELKDVGINRWIILVLGISTTLSMTFYMLLLRFKTYGMLTIGLVLLMYFITNGALGSSSINNSVVEVLQWLNPLLYFEKPLQSIISNQDMSLIPTVLVLASITISSIIVIYILQPFAYRQNERNTEEH